MDELKAKVEELNKTIENMDKVVKKLTDSNAALEAELVEVKTVKKEEKREPFLGGMSNDY